MTTSPSDPLRPENQETARDLEYEPGSGHIDATGVPPHQLVEPFRRLADGIPHVVWITQLNPERVIYVSPSFEHTWGRTPAELYADPRIWTASIHPEDRHRVEEAFVTWITGTSPQCQRFEYRVIQPSGNVRWITDIGVVTFDEHGKATRISGVCTDITELKLAEREHLAHLWFFESLDRVNQAIQGADELEHMLREVLTQLLEIFDCERASLRVPGDARRDVEVARSALPASSGTVLSSELRPNGIEPHVLALHHFRQPRAWMNEQERLFREIGRRLGDAIGTWWSVRRLRESEQRLEAAQRQAQLGYWSLDLESGLMTFSAETFRICGLEPADRPLALADLKQLVHSADLERVWAAARATLSGTGEYRQVHRIVRPSSELRYVHTEGQVMRNREGRPTSLFGTAQDITERKRAEQLFAAQHAVTKLLAELTSPEEAAPRILQAICQTLDWDVGLLWPAGSVAAGQRPTAVWCASGVPVDVWLNGSFSPPTQFADDAPWFVSDIADTGKLHAAFGFSVPLSDGVWGRLVFLSVETRRSDADLLAAMATLGSQIGQFVERRRAETALQRARDQLAHVTRVASLGELTASIAHEVNQPLTGIIANGQAALRWLKHDPPEVPEANECLQRLVRDGKRAGEVVGRLRTLVRQGEEVRKTRLDVGQVVRETLPLVRSDVQQNEVTIVLDLAEALEAAFADRVQIQQVLLNLIMNAVEAMVAVQDRPRQLVLRTAPHERGYVAVTVADSGVGVEPSQAAQIFEPFFTTKTHGMGMGLAISRSIVEDHGGRFSLTARAGGGSVFEFTLPEAPASGGEEQRP